MLGGILCLICCRINQTMKSSHTMKKLMFAKKIRGLSKGYEISTRKEIVSIGWVMGLDKQICTDL